MPRPHRSDSGGTGYWYVRAVMPKRRVRRKSSTPWPYCGTLGAARHLLSGMRHASPAARPSATRAFIRQIKPRASPVCPGRHIVGWRETGPPVPAACYQVGAPVAQHDPV